MKVQIARFAPNQIPYNDLSMLTPEAILTTWNLPVDAQVIDVKTAPAEGNVDDSYDVYIQSESYPDVENPPFFTPDIDAAKSASYRAAQGWS